VAIFFPIGNIPGTNATFTDLTYNSFSNSEYVIDVNWNISCSPTRNVNTTRSNIRKKYIDDSLLIVNTTLIDEEYISIYPNPIDEYAIIDFETLHETIANVSVYDVAGKKINELKHTEALDNNKAFYKIDTQTWATGIYTVIVQLYDGKKIMAKLAKY
jgi:hypothetical protein